MLVAGSRLCWWRLLVIVESGDSRKRVEWWNGGPVPLGYAPMWSLRVCGMHRRCGRRWGLHLRLQVCLRLRLRLRLSLRLRLRLRLYLCLLRL